MNFLKKYVITFLVMACLTIFCLSNCKSSDDSDSKKNKPWAETHKVNPNLDLDKISEAFFNAKGPSDFEEKVNELYTGDGVVLIAVRSVANDKQEVAGYVDKNNNQTDEESERLFVLTRKSVVDGTDGKKMDYEMRGYGHNHGYHHSGSHMITGLMMGYMVGRMMSPGYMGYRTPMTRQTTLRNHQTSHRKTPDYKRTVGDTKKLGNTSKYNKMSKGSGSWKRGSVGSRSSRGSVGSAPKGRSK